MGLARIAAFLLAFLVWLWMSCAIEERRQRVAGPPKTRLAKVSSAVFHGRGMVRAMFGVPGPYRYLAYQVMAFMGVVALLMFADQAIG
jgi:hypothetical protein